MQGAASHRVHILGLTSDAPPEFIAAASELLREYGEFIRNDGQAAHFCYSTLEQEAAELPTSYLSRGGEMLVAVAELLADGQRAVEAIGCVGWRRIPPPVEHERAAELKRLWVQPPARGRGAAGELVRAAIQAATAAGCDSLYLDTIETSMPAATALYRRLGFLPCPPYAGKALPGVSYLRLSLSPA